MATFERLTNGSVIYTDDNGRKHGLDGKMNVLPHPDKPDLILISHEAYNHYQQKSITVNATSVTIPAHTDRNDLVLKLKTDFFFNDIELRTQTLENYELLVEISQNIGTNTTGTIVIPAGSTLERSAYPNNDAGTDDETALVAFTDLDGQASDRPATDNTDNYIFVLDVDISLNYTLTGTPSAAASLLFVVRLKLKDWQNLAGFNTLNFRTLIPENTGSNFQYYFVNRAPLATDDVNDGYNVGDRWIDTVAKHEYLLLSNAVNAAVWKITTMDIDANGNVTFTGGVTFESGISYGDAANFTISANTNDLAITLNQVLIRLTSTGNYNLTGVLCPDPESTLTIYIVNIGVNNVTLKNNDANSLAQNRFNMGADILLQPGEAIIFVYDTIANKWQAFAKNI